MRHTKHSFQKKLQRLGASILRDKRKLATSFAVIFAIIGLIFLVVVRAAPIFVSVEPELGTLTAGATVVSNDASASGQKYVHFAEASQPNSPNCSAAAPNGVGGSWNMIFCDDFTGTTLNVTKWQMCNASFPNPQQLGAQYCRTSYNDEQQIFRMAPTNNPNVKVSDGYLHLITTKENGKIYSGMISTGPNKTNYNLPGYQPFLFKYGYVEARAKFPRGKGFWPSFWMLPDQTKYGGWPNSGEYDIAEIPGNDPSHVHMTKHDDQASGGAPLQQGFGKIKYGLSPDAAAAYHTYGFEWGADFVKWYIDGKLEFQILNNAYIKDYPFYVTANFSVGGYNSWGGPQGPLKGGYDATTPFPSEFTIDYMRIFQRK